MTRHTEGPLAHTGACFCGAVRFSVEGDVGGVISCHCRDCQRLTGNYGALVVVDKAATTIEGEDALRWYDTGPGSRRAFCATCGSRLLKDKGTDKWIVSVGAFDPPLDVRNAKNIFIGSKGSWYELTPAGAQGG